MLTSLSSRIGAVKLDITLNCLNARYVLLDGTDSHRVVELVNSLLEAQFEKLILNSSSLASSSLAESFLISLAFIPVHHPFLP